MIDWLIRSPAVTWGFLFHAINWLEMRYIVDFHIDLLRLVRIYTDLLPFIGGFFYFSIYK